MPTVVIRGVYLSAERSAVRVAGYGWCAYATSGPPSFSERRGVDRPILRVRGWRVFVLRVRGKFWKPGET